jgi:hypothetical protein
MPELGNRANVMGPQPIAQPLPIPPEVTAASERIVKLIASGDVAGLEAMATDRARADAGALAHGVRAGAYNSHAVVGQARANRHYYVKTRLIGPDAAPMLIQVRLGEQDGRWLIWEAKNLTGRRSAWTK